MDPVDVFSTKASVYARHRWDYAQPAIQTIFDVTQVSHQSTVADIGAGTGILTRHFVGQVERVFAVEPNLHMRDMAVRALGARPGCEIVDGRAEATTLPDRCVDLITVAQAIGWFEPQATRIEFSRILRPGGWLALLRNYGTDRELDEAVKAIFPVESSLDTPAVRRGKGTPMRYYYGGDHFLKRTYPFTTQRDWGQFIGSLSTTSDAPDKGSPQYMEFVRAARDVFDRFSSGGTVRSGAVTELHLGQMRSR